MLITPKICNYFVNYTGMNLSIMLQEKKYICGNNKPFMTKVLSKSIMERTCLRNTFLKNPIVANKLAYTKQRHFCVSQYFANLNEKNITDNRKFWQIVKPFLSEKIKSREKITLVKMRKSYLMMWR